MTIVKREQISFPQTSEGIELANKYEKELHSYASNIKRKEDTQYITITAEIFYKI